jgi:spermidine synthase
VAVAGVCLTLLFLYRGDSLWSPYYKIDIDQLMLEGASADQGDVIWGHRIVVNHDYHQKALDLSPEFVDRYGNLSSDVETAQRAYDLPYDFIEPADVLIVGAGAGNDVASALRYGALRVDAVEIDPLIAELGERLHPEMPYQSSRTNLIVDDARSFFEKNDRKYDLIVFGFLDSHTLLSSMSSVRLDNFVYTLECFEEAKSHLKDDGVVALTFSVAKKWIGARLRDMLATVFDSNPVAFEVGYDGGVTFIVGPGMDSTELTEEHRLQVLAAERRLDFKGVAPPATDDWPYLYLREHTVPDVYWQVLLLLLILSVIVILLVFPESTNVSLHFFFLGCAFFLLETKSITEAALLFGSTWIVNSVVISAILLMILGANLFHGAAEHRSRTALSAQRPHIRLRDVASPVLRRDHLCHLAEEDAYRRSSLWVKPTWIGGGWNGGVHLVDLRHKSSLSRRGFRLCLVLAGFASRDQIGGDTWRRTRWSPRGAVVISVVERIRQYAREQARGPLARLDFGLLVVVSLPVFIVLLLAQPGLPRTADGYLHLLRTVEVDQSWRDGIFYPRWAPDMAFGYGYPIFNYFAPLLYLITEAVHLLGPGFESSLKLVLIGSLLCGAGGMYALVKDHLGARAGVLAAATYIYAPYMLRDVFVSGVYAEFLALSLMPLALWSVYRLITRGNPLYLLTSSLLCGAVVISHNITGMLFFPLLVSFAVWTIWSHRRRSAILRTVLALILSLALVALFLLPALVEKPLVNLDRLTEDYFDFRQHFLSLAEILSPSVVPDGRSFNPVWLLNLGTAQVFLAALGVLALVVGYLARWQRMQGLFFVLVLVISVAMMLPVSTPVWQHVPLVAFTEFPWRFLGPAVLASSFLAGNSVHLWSRLRWRHSSTVLLALSVIFTVGAVFVHLYQEWPPSRREDLSPQDVVQHELRTGIVGTTSASECLWKNPLTHLSSLSIFLPAQSRSWMRGVSLNPRESSCLAIRWCLTSIAWNSRLP